MKIHVQDFQSIGHASLDAQGLTVIVGPSDRGKSALIRAIEAAMFNRPGDQFVRVGQPWSYVLLDFFDRQDPDVVVPTPDGTHRIEWKKGKGVNKFTVDGDDYSRVGTKAPKPLQDLGFKDVLIGARLTDEGKFEGGKWIRPQVARQLPPEIFLLDESGPFLNEVLVGLSRVGVLQRAGRFCAADLRQTKTQLTLRRTDLEEAEADVTELTPIVALRDRVQLLQARYDTWQQTQGRVERLRRLVAERSMVEARVKLTLPPVAVKERDIHGLQKTLSTIKQLRSWLPIRETVQAALQTPLPKERKVKKATVTLTQKYLLLRPMVIDQRQNRNWLQEYTTTVTRWTNAIDAWREAEDRIKAELKICPLCDKPF